MWWTDQSASEARCYSRRPVKITKHDPRRSHRRLRPLPSILVALALAAVAVSDRPDGPPHRARRAARLPHARAAHPGRGAQARRCASRRPRPRTLIERADVLRRWVDAFSLTGRPMAINATTLFANINELRDTGKIADGTRAADDVRQPREGRRRLRARARAQGRGAGRAGRDRALDRRGPFVVRLVPDDRADLHRRQPRAATGRAASGRPPAHGGLRAVPDRGRQGRQLRQRARLGPRASASPSRSVPFAGPHGGFRADAPVLAFRLESGTLDPGETATVVYGDRSGGGKGWRVQIVLHRRRAAAALRRPRRVRRLPHAELGVVRGGRRQGRGRCA